MQFPVKPYTAYKPSGVQWIGNVPEHWDVRRLKRVLKERDTRSTGGREQLLRVSQYTGVTQRAPADGSDMPDSRAESLVGYKSVERNDLVVNIMLAWNGSMGVSKYRGIVSPAYCVYEFMPPGLPWYFHYLIRSEIYKAYIKTASTGVVDSRLRLYTDDLYRLYAIVPRLPEQAAIVRYLDHVDERIRRCVSVKQKLIRLLEEEKKALIKRAVTRGLDPDVRLKRSGVEWLGDVPAHWEVGPVKRAFLSMDYGISESATDSDNIRLLTMAHLNDGKVNVPANGGVDFVNPHLLLRKNDLLFNRTNSQELVGKVGLFTGHDCPVTFASYLVRMRPCPNHEPAYLNLVLNDSSFISRARREAIPSLHQSNLNPTRYGRLHVVLPPKQEQQTILRALRKETKDFRHAIRRTYRQIELLQEYRTRLVADVVTGKLDVRGASARSPEIDSLETESGPAREQKKAST